MKIFDFFLLYSLIYWCSEGDINIIVVCCDWLMYVNDEII